LATDGLVEENPSPGSAGLLSQAGHHVQLCDSLKEVVVNEAFELLLGLHAARSMKWWWRRTDFLLLGMAAGTVSDLLAVAPRLMGQLPWGAVDRYNPGRGADLLRRCRAERAANAVAAGAQRGTVTPAL
jgi:hypothetical protein